MHAYESDEVTAVHSIDHFSLNVPSIDDAERFYTAFGLDVRRVTRGTRVELEVRALDGHLWMKVFASVKKSLSYLSFSCFEGDLAAIVRQVDEAGGNLNIDIPSRLEGIQYEPHGLWFEDPDGNLINVKVGPKTSPDSKTPLSRSEVAANERGAVSRAEVSPVRPRRMSHVLLFTPDVLRTVAFYERSIGLCLSDRSQDIIAFMHGRHGSDHHLVGLAKSSAKGFHHVSWDVAGIDEVGSGSAQMIRAGYDQGWGTGRHVLGSNYFHYVMDPWGSFCEYSADIDFISKGFKWEAGVHPTEDSLYLWGPDVPPHFVHNTEASRRSEPS